MKWAVFTEDNGAQGQTVEADDAEVRQDGTLVFWRFGVPDVHAATIVRAFRVWTDCKIVE